MKSITKPKTKSAQLKRLSADSAAALALSKRPDAAAMLKHADTLLAGVGFGQERIAEARAAIALVRGCQGDVVNACSGDTLAQTSEAWRLLLATMPLIPRKMEHHIDRAEMSVLFAINHEAQRRMLSIP